jgi:hypothetical protein
VRAQPIHRSHLRLLCFYAGIPFAIEDERIFAVGIHVLHDVALVLS